jgi:hypothetical protein
MSMCPGTEFGIKDAVMGVLTGIVAYVVMAIAPNWWFLWGGLWLSTAGWIGMSIYAFRFASKCNCKQLEADLKATLDKIDISLQNKK